MTDHSHLEASTAFPPAPETDRTPTPAKRTASKKTAKAAAKEPAIKAAKKSAKKATKKAAKKAAAEPLAEKAPAAPAPAPVRAPAPTPEPELPLEPSRAPAPRQPQSAQRPQGKAHAPRSAEPTVVTPPPATPPQPPVEAAPPVPVAETPAPAPATPAAPTSQPPPPNGEHQHQQGGQREHRHGRHERHRERDRERFQKPQREPQPERPLGPPEPTEGILELTPKGYGFLRQKSRQWAALADDPFVSPEWIRKLGLREGMFIKGTARLGHRGPQLTEISEVMGLNPEAVRDLPLFEELKAINPNKRIQLETRPDRLTTRVMDLVTPVGRGQRGLIVAPPRAGKTTLLQHIAEAVVQNHPQIHLMLLLVDERPEEVTEFRRSLPGAEILASSNDSDLKSHIRIASFAIERAKRLVECGRHVFILLDSITRMARAFNNAHKGGATASGGLGVGALESPRRLFAAARNTREAGSLTILATTLIETNSRMDDAIFQEFKGTGNLELVLDRKIAEQYIYPAVNIFKSGTRREELLLPPFQMEKVHLLRRGLAGHKPIDAIQRVITLMERSPNNSQMLIELPGKTN